MELKLNVSIGATLQVKNSRGEWDWIKPEVGCEIKLVDGEIKADTLQEQFSAMWDNVVGPQFHNVVQELLADEIPVEKEVEAVETVEAVVDTEDEYY